MGLTKILECVAEARDRMLAMQTKAEHRSFVSGPQAAVPTFAEFADNIRNLSFRAPTETELSVFLVLAENEKIRIYYAPFDWTNTEAEVVIVGITPGEDSMMNAFRAAASALRLGVSDREASERGKRAGSFSNMRFTIADMLDELGLPEILNINRSEELFSTRYDLLHSTSCVRYPVLVWGQKKGKWLNCLFGFPHASGANGHRKKFFEKRKEHLRQTLADWALWKKR